MALNVQLMVLCNKPSQKFNKMFLKFLKIPFFVYTVKSNDKMGIINKCRWLSYAHT